MCVGGGTDGQCETLGGYWPPPKSGKSSTIGTLVSQQGKGSGGDRDVLLRTGGWLRIRSYRQSQQEAKRTPEASSSLIPSSVRNVLFALRSDIVHGLPDAEGYLQHFVQIGWTIESVVLLDCSDDYDRYAAFGAPVGLVEDSTELTSKPLKRNWVFAQVRNHFQWA